ncbi:hypothetical protein, partial [Flammeovirga aprica]
ERVYNFEVEGYHSYYADGIYVHNDYALPELIANKLDELKLDDKLRAHFINDYNKGGEFKRYFDEINSKNTDRISDLIELWNELWKRDLKIGEVIGEGGNKFVHDIFGSDDMVVAILKVGKPINSIPKEMELLEVLFKNGLPVVEVFQFTPRTMLMKKYVQGSKDIVKVVKKKPTIVGGSEYLNQNSVEDLLKIKSIMVKKKIQINDLQFLIDKEGRVVIADPLDVYEKVSPNNKNIRMIDLLIEVAKKNN